MIVRMAIVCFFSFISIQSSPTIRKINVTGKEIFELISTRETKNCIVSLVTMNNVVYLVKQKKDSKKQLAVVRDALASYIAEDLHIAQHIAIVSSEKQIPGKTKSSWPATIHSLAPGKTVREQKESKYNALRLRQFWAGVKTLAEKGLTRTIITHMTWHEDLPVIVALDLLIGNSDRHCGNICYDPSTDTFFAIDMDDTFNKDLCAFASKKIKYMLEQDEVVFTWEEIKALAAMRDTLKFLVKRHNPKILVKKLYSFAKKAGFYKGSKMYTPRIANKLAHYEKTIAESYASAHKLIVLLDKTVARKSRKRML